MHVYAKENLKIAKIEVCERKNLTTKTETYTEVHTLKKYTDKRKKLLIKKIFMIIIYGCKIIIIQSDSAVILITFNNRTDPKQQINFSYLRKHTIKKSDCQISAYKYQKLPFSGHTTAATASLLSQKG